MTMIDICTDLELPSRGDLWQGFRCKKIYHEYSDRVAECHFVSSRNRSCQKTYC
ncbi:unnamed protein product [Onchocerca flexuosa]|uniref:BPTI/Kunitz inhibitor domain-containing protein n=1 Tax=Onchocerca flexuosa TaxID=387005 RepID=A0A183GZV5_9BILA|nr:unnamed protein product [Onchocerca flexuosa]